MRSRALLRYVPRPLLSFLGALTVYFLIKPYLLSEATKEIPFIHTTAGALRIYRQRIVAVGDLHGDLEHTLRVLRMASIVDHRAKWIAGPSTVLVQTGDIVDRGKDTIALYRLFTQLAEQGQVVNLMGNHGKFNSRWLA